MESRKQKVARKLRDLQQGREPHVTKADLMAHMPGEVPLPEERAVLQLAHAIHRAESSDAVTSWSAQERAMDFFNTHGLGATLDRMFELEKEAAGAGTE